MATVDPTATQLASIPQSLPAHLRWASHSRLSPPGKSAVAVYRSLTCRCWLALWGVSVETLIGEKAAPTRRGPTPKMQQQIERLSSLCSSCSAAPPAIEYLTREAQVEGKCAGSTRIGIRGIRAKRMGVPRPHSRIVTRSGDLSGGISLRVLNIASGTS